MTTGVMEDVDTAIEALMEEPSQNDVSETNTALGENLPVTRIMLQYLYRVGVVDSSLLMAGEPREMKSDGSCQSVRGGFTKEMIRSKSRHEVNVDSGDDHQEIYAFSFLPPLEDIAAGAPVEGNAYVDQLKRDNAFRNPKSYGNMLHAFGVEEHRSFLHGDLDEMAPKLPAAKGGADADEEKVGSVHTRQTSDRSEESSKKWRYESLHLLQSREWAQQRTQKAKQALDQGYYKEALKCCDQALALEKDTIEAYLIKAEVYELRREMKESEQVLSQALKLDENHRTARKSLQRVQEKLRTLGLNPEREPSSSSAEESGANTEHPTKVSAPASLDRGRLRDLLIQQMKEKHNYAGQSSSVSKDVLADSHSESKRTDSAARSNSSSREKERGRRRSRSKRSEETQERSSSSKDKKRHKSKRHKSSHGRRSSSARHRQRSSRGSSV